MPGEIVNTLGFEVGDALAALAKLDELLKQNENSFNALAGSLNSWNSAASTTIDRLRQIVAAAREAAGSLKGVQSPSVTPATGATSSLWLPAGVREEPAPAAAPEAVAASSSAATAATQTLSASLREAAKLYEQTRTPQERYNTELTRLKNLADSGAISQDTYTRGVRQAGEALKEASTQTNKWTVSWETLARVVMTQFIVRAMSQIRDALKEAVAESIEFQRRIAEVQTIAPTIGGSFSQLTSEAAEFAKRFNVPLTESTEGLYQTISAQFSSISDRADIMTAAMKLAKVGVMDFHDAVSLITGTLNAYGMASSEAESVAAKFFTTIRLGKVRGQELAQVMGQVIPIAGELGINLDEVNSAMIAMTIGGMDAAKAATGLRGTMTALLKPSEDMKKVIRELGFSSPEQLIGAKGYQGALLAIAEASDNMASEIAKSVRNVRALTAELRLTQTGAEQVAAAMKAMQESTPEALDKIFKQFTSTDSEKLTSTINRLKVDLTQDFGASLTGLLATMAKVGGGADQLSAAIQAIGFAAIPAGIALAGLATAAMTAQLAMGPVGWTLLGVAAATSVLVGGTTYMTAVSINETRRLSEEQHTATVQYLKDKEEELRKLRDVESQKMTEEIRSYENRASVIRRDYFAALDSLKDKNKQVIESDRQAMEAAISSQERVVAAYRNAANSALRIVQESERTRATLEGQYEDQRFKERTTQELKLTTHERAQATLRRSWDLEALANKTLAGAQTEDDVRRSQTIAQRAKAYLDEGAALARESGDTWLIYQAEQSISDNLEDQIKAHKQLESRQAARAQALAADATKEQERLDAMKSLTKAILTDLQAFDKNGPKTPKELAEQQARLTKNMAEFRDKFMEGRKVDVGDLLGLDQLQRRVTLALEGGISKVEIDKLYSAPETFAEFRDEIEKGIGPVRVWIKAAQLSNVEIANATKGMTAEETLDYLSKAEANSKEVITTYRSARDSLAVAEDSLRKGREEVSSAFTHWLGQGAGKPMAGGNFWESVADYFTEGATNTPAANKVRDRLMQATTKFGGLNPKPLAADLDELDAAYKKYAEILQPGEASKAAFEEFKKKAAMMVGNVQHIHELEQGLGAMGPGAAQAFQNLPGLQDALKAGEDEAKKKLESQTPQKKLDDLNSSATRFKTSMSEVPDMGTLATNLMTSAGAMDRIVAGAGSLSGFGTVLNAATGGKVWDFLAAGGRARGTDTEPAMLSPREIVMNERAAQRFSSQLFAMNAGVQPSFHSQGGSVTNVGDINVTVSGGGSSRQTARSIATELRRELRRGTSTL